MRHPGEFVRFCLILKSAIIFMAILVVSRPAISQDNWTLVKSEPNLKVYTSPVKGSSIRKFKITADCRGRLADAEKLFRDLSAMPDWYEGVKVATLTKRISDHEAEYMLVYSMPFPLTDRVATIRGVMESTESGLTIKTNYYPGNIPVAYKKLVNVTQIWSSWEIHKRSSGRLEIMHTGFMDPAGPVPDWLINLKLTDIPVKTIKNLQHILSQENH